MAVKEHCNYLPGNGGFERDIGLVSSLPSAIPVLGPGQRKRVVKFLIQVEVAFQGRPGQVEVGIRGVAGRSNGEFGRGSSCESCSWVCLSDVKGGNRGF